MFSFQTKNTRKSDPKEVVLSSNLGKYGKSGSPKSSSPRVSPKSPRISAGSSQAKPKALVFPKKKIQNDSTNKPETKSRQSYQHSHSSGINNNNNHSQNQSQIQSSKSPKSSGQTKFEADMEQHGLQKKIKDIQSLNTYFQSEIGKNPANIRSQIVPGSADEAKKQLMKKSDNKKSPKNTQQEFITFPYQRRARSFSPPKNEPNAKIYQAHSPRSKEEQQKAKPVVAKNFICGKKLMNLNKKKEEPVNKAEESKDRVKNLMAMRENISSKNKNYNLEEVPQIPKKEIDQKLPEKKQNYNINLPIVKGQTSPKNSQKQNRKSIPLKK